MLKMFDRKQIMKKAWGIKKNKRNQDLDFGRCLKLAWAEAKGCQMTGTDKQKVWAVDILAKADIAVKEMIEKEFVGEFSDKKEAALEVLRSGLEKMNKMYAGNIIEKFQYFSFREESDAHVFVQWMRQMTEK